MPSLKHLVGVGLGTLALLAGGAATAPSASAGVVTKTCGVSVGGVTNSTKLCLERLSYGYRVSYKNETGQALHLSFGLRCGTSIYYDDGSFMSYPGWTSSYIFNIGIKPWCQGLLYDWDQEMWFGTNKI
ncbi:hypothetical protein [Kitasatospora indigofera]|uniref:hypothetical protein n=1 Tax=Kitasatospora indigofera TaxID=67307 RepID=UPI0036D11EDB